MRKHSKRIGVTVTGVAVVNGTLRMGMTVRGPEDSWVQFCLATLPGSVLTPDECEALLTASVMARRGLEPEEEPLFDI